MRAEEIAIIIIAAVIILLPTVIRFIMPDRLPQGKNPLFELLLGAFGWAGSQDREQLQDRSDRIPDLNYLVATELNEREQRIYGYRSEGMTLQEIAEAVDADHRSVRIELDEIDMKLEHALNKHVEYS